ncbi:acyltransferase family protein [Candidatus Planktophila dulcis]|uniref:acyltransferase family protein n=1 Tax=Candidatus Planktophila dulcis TaxID=1884914 RepID=UPI003CF30AE2
MNQSRMYALDGARGFAAFCILLFHAVGTRINVFSHLYIAVDFFFVLSGFVLAPTVARVRNSKDAGRFLASRFIRIFPMVLAIILFSTVYDLVIIVKHWLLEEPATSPIILSIPTLVVSLLILHVFYSPAILVDYPVWSLSAEWVANVVVTLIQVFTSKSKYISLACGAILIIASAVYEFELMNQLGRALWGFSLGLIAFAFRYEYSKYRIHIFLVSLFLVPIYFATSNLGEYQALLTVWPFTACILIFSMLSTPPNISKFFAVIGKYSYGFYLWHFPLLSLTSFALNKFDFDSTSTLRAVLEISLTSILSILATKASLRFIEEPIRRYWGVNSRMV